MINMFSMLPWFDFCSVGEFVFLFGKGSTILAHGIVSDDPDLRVNHPLLFVDTVGGTTIGSRHIIIQYCICITL